MPKPLQAVLGDSRLPESIKAPLRDGGIRALTKDELVERTDALVAELKSGEDGRDRLLRDPTLSADAEATARQYSFARLE